MKIWRKKIRYEGKRMPEKTGTHIFKVEESCPFHGNSEITYLYCRCFYFKNFFMKPVEKIDEYCMFEKNIEMRRTS